MLQRKVSDLIRALAAYGLLTCLAAALVVGQVNEPNDLFICKEVETKVASEITISKVQRRVAYVDECRLYFESGKEWVSISTEKFKTQKESKEAFPSTFEYLTLSEIYPENVRNLKRHGVWDDAKGFTNESNSDHVIMLRYKEIIFTLISSEYELIERTESVLRTLQFDRNEK